VRIEFADWFFDQQVTQETKDLFAEAVVCYKASAYRSALLMSYTGFLTIVRDRVLVAGCPAGIAAGDWGIIQGRLRNDDLWEKEAYDATQKRMPAPIFELSEDLRHQVTYWKNRRNDCAHAKANRIEFAHVEAFWLFVRSNLGRFVVRGSRAALLDLIRNHYDPRLNPLGEDPSYIVEMIPHSIELAEIADFLADIRGLFRGHAPILGTHVPVFLDLYNRIVGLNNDAITREVIRFLEADIDLFMGFLRAFPERVHLLADNAPLVRNLWFDRLFSSQGDLQVYGALLRNSLIPPEQIREAHRVVVRRWQDEIPDEGCQTILRETGFFDEFCEYAFEGGYVRIFEWANANRDVIAWYVERFPLTPAIVRAICTTFEPANYPWHLRDPLGTLFRDNAEKREQFRDLAQAQGLALPSHLPELTPDVQP